MRWVRMTVLALTAAGIVASAVPVSARTLKVSRLADATIDFCLHGAKCAPVAIGDFNGDGNDDALFQQNVGGERMLHVVFGPFGNQPQPVTKLGFVDEIGLLAVDVADLNGDGQDELIVADVSHHPDGTQDEQSVNVIDFKLLKAFGEDPSVWEESYYIGRARSPFRWARTVPLGGTSKEMRTGRLSVRAADVNGDGGMDIVLGVDPTVNAATSANRNAALAPGQAAGQASGGDSEVIVQILPRDFFFAKPADMPDGNGFKGRSWPLSRMDIAAGQESVRITGLGACTRGGLADVADVTGDAAPDIVVRRCEGGPMPDQLGLVAGRTSWPQAITIDGAVRPSTPPQPGPVTPPEPPRGGGYVQFDPRGPGVNVFDGLATFFTADLNADGLLDIGFGQGDKTHVWLGGADLSERLLADRSDRIFLSAGLGGSMVNRSWKPTDLDGDGHRDLALTRMRTAVPTQREASGRAAFESSPTEPLHVFARNRDADEVIDVSSDAPDGVWNNAEFTLWAFGDFNGDGLDDVMLGSPASALESVYPVVYGPFLRR